MSEVLSVFVPGDAVGKGSVRAFAHRTTGRIVTTSASRGLPAWEHAIREAAFAELGEAWQLLTGPVSVRLRFVMQRPKSHFRANGSLRADAPSWHTGNRDLDKLERTALDALTGVLYRDDGQVAELIGRKPYGARPGLFVSVATLSETP